MMPAYFLWVLDFYRLCSRYCGHMLFPQYDCMTSSQNQDPCLVTSWLYVPCYGTGAPSVVSKIDHGVNYGGPPSRDPSESTPCDCNTVIYSLRAACGACQGGGALQWPSSTVNCLSTYDNLKIYPELIPGGTAVPRWAYLEVLSNNGTFNLDAAKAIASQDLPDVTTGNTSIALPSPTSTIIVTVAEMTAPVSNTQQSNVGAIGGVLGLLLILGIILYIVLRHRRLRQIRGDPSIQPSSSQTGPVREVSVSESGHYPLKGDAGNIIRGFYDPNDPRTYPPTEGSGIGYTRLPQIMP